MWEVSPSNESHNNSDGFTSTMSTRQSHSGSGPQCPNILTEIISESESGLMSVFDLIMSVLMTFIIPLSGSVHCVQSKSYSGWTGINR